MQALTDAPLASVSLQCEAGQLLTAHLTCSLPAPGPVSSPCTKQWFPLFLPVVVKLLPGTFSRLDSLVLSAQAARLSAGP